MEGYIGRRARHEGTCTRLTIWPGVSEKRGDGVNIEKI